jgi:hypothetical protein
VALGTHVNHSINDADEKDLQLGGILASPMEAVKYKPETRDSINRDMLKHYAHARSLEPDLARANRVAKSYHNWRDVLLIAGFATIFLAKVLQPYEKDFVPLSASIYRIMNVTPPTEHQQASQDNITLQSGGITKTQAGQQATSSSNQSTNSGLQTPATNAQTSPPPKGTN